MYLGEDSRAGESNETPKVFSFTKILINKWLLILNSNFCLN